MAIKIPIITTFAGEGIQKAIKSFKQLETASDKVKFVLKAGAVAGAAAFAALGAAALQAGQALVGFARMAADDEKGQKQLALSIRASTKATDAQIASVEDYIDVTQRAVGVADDELRPAYARIIRSTRDFDKAQRLLNVALNVSAATGKPLQAVTEALSRAYNGSNTALTRLGLGYDKVKLKGMDFNDVQQDLEKRFSGSALANAQTFEGTMARFRITIDELKESLGQAVLPYLKRLAEYGIQIADAFGKDGVAGAFAELKYILKSLLYDENGQLNQAGRTLNDLAEKANKLASVFNFAQRAASATPVGAVANRIGGAFGFDPTPNVGSVSTLPSFRLPGRNPENAQVTINVYGVVGDAASVGKAVNQSIRAWERRSGGR
jgi:tetratricopeptide (TPR) repeat protein